MFSKLLEQSLNEAFSRARNKRYEFITVEHLLLELTSNIEVSDALGACGANVNRLRKGIGVFIEETTPVLPVDADRDTQPTLSFQRVLQRAIYQAQVSSAHEVSGLNVLTAIFGEQESQSVYFLSQENVSRIDVINYITHGIGKNNDASGFYEQQDSGPSEMDSPFNKPIFDQPELETDNSEEEALIENYTENLNKKALLGKIDPLIGREDELDRMVQVLCRRSKNNPLLVGEAGVGKTAVAEGLAQCIIESRVPEALRNHTVYSLDLGILLAGTKYRGDFEKRFKSVLKALSRDSGAIIFIDEIHNLVGAGSATGGTMDAANMIKPMLSRGELRCIGATTYDEFRNHIAKDNALVRRFQKIDVEEPSAEDAENILKGLRNKFEKFHELKYSDEALSAAVHLSIRYLTNRKLPDKAIDVIDEAGSFRHLHPNKKNEISVTDIEKVIAKMARIPEQQVSCSDRDLLKNLASNMKKQVFGQDEAIARLSDAIKLSRSGLRDQRKPIGSFLMSGPTGVGKTEITRQLAKELGVPLVRFDMSEYMEKHAVSRLIGAPPGYVGFDQGGLLTEKINKHPHCVLLLDEIEKAHPDLFNILLQVMDYGSLTDTNGRTADMRHVILVMTTNAGARVIESQNIGFAPETEGQGNDLSILQKLFSPEFRNRLDAIVPFKHLSHETISLIVDKHMEELRTKLLEKETALKISSSARDWLSNAGYDKNMGARPMQRLIQEIVKKPLAEELLFGKLANNNKKKVSIGVTNNKIKIKID